MGGNEVRLLAGGDELFPAMQAAIAAARHEVWLATYIFHNDDAARGVAEALAGAAARGVRVRVVVDGFGSRATLPDLQRWWEHRHVALAVFRPLDRWYSWLHPFSWFGGSGSGCGSGGCGSSTSCGYGGCGAQPTTAYCCGSTGAEYACGSTGAAYCCTSGAAAYCCGSTGAGSGCRA